jgi:hypothetical protein
MHHGHKRIDPSLVYSILATRNWQECILRVIVTSLYCAYADWRMSSYIRITRMQRSALGQFHDGQFFKCLHCLNNAVPVIMTVEHGLEDSRSKEGNKNIFDRIIGLNNCKSTISCRSWWPNCSNWHASPKQRAGSATTTTKGTSNGRNLGKQTQL